jgi:hypothetical protein
MPERMKTEVKTRRFSAKKRDLIQGLDLLIIDEISMVRADMLDAIDAVLRHVRRNDEPFGGLQLLMIGDLHQLPPVVKDEDWREMREVYKTSYFFASQALRQARAQVIQLKHIYRQQDEVFIGLLNKVRNNEMDKEVLEQLNSRYVKGFSPDKEEGYITLSSHNNTARAINQEKLKELGAKAYKFKATLGGDFPGSMFPNEEELIFKVGAQVMFNKNDTGEVREYFNGKIGTISSIKGDEITVRCPGSGAIVVEPVKWENRKYSLNKDKEVEEDVVGTYEQHPLRLAWAITIHKSQGLTFDKVVIDAGAAFAHGQVYVALSRCRTFEGIVLRTRIGDSSVKTDAIVSSYSAHAEKNQPTEETLQEDRRKFELRCLKELFTFKDAEYAAAQLHRSLFEHEKAIQGEAHAEFWKMKEDLLAKAVKVGHGFIGHIDNYGKAEELPSQHPELTVRLKKAGAYFTKYLAEEFLPAMAMFGVMTDNKSVKMQVEERSKELIRQLFKKLKGFTTLEDGFDPKAYLTARANAEIDFEKQQKTTTVKEKAKVILPKDLAHPELYLRLSEWRQAVCEEREVPAYTIAHNRTLLEIAALLPTEKKSMLRINGVGPKRFDDFGLAMIEIVREYLEKREEAETDLFSVAKADTRQVSLDLFREGKTIEEIAKLRELVSSTITTHLTHWVKEGDLPVSAVVDQKLVDTLLPYMKAHPELSLNDYHKHFKGAYDYGVLKLVRTQV